MAFYKGDSREADRVLHLRKGMEKRQEDLELKRKQHELELNESVKISEKFHKLSDETETKLSMSTVGLLSLEEMKTVREMFRSEQEDAKANDVTPKKMKKISIPKCKLEKLSFDLFPDDEEDVIEDEENVNLKEECEEKKKIMETDKKEEEVEEEEEEEDIQLKLTKGDKKKDFLKLKGRKRLGMNPNVNTNFLPDRDRELLEEKLRKELDAEWNQQQQELKETILDITYSYWDGTGHRRQVKVARGATIHEFLHRSLDDLRKEQQFNELRTATADQLIYVKEDIIIPQFYTFHDLITTKARGKSGPLFYFDVRDDIRLVTNAKVEKEDSHAGKVILRNWYERHKHIFPACRWEAYDPHKKWDTYTIKDSRKK
ncbi:hypothetical protein SNEBB_008115 [Seison nebaliae]|nr:hypothetical protein SNEBB_008115 [Seison nebaliae]